MTVSLVHPLPSGTPTGGFRLRPAFTENGVHVPAMLHNGQDWGAPAGTLIRAAHAGTVSGVFYDAAQGGGWMVRIHAPFGYTMYGHMLRQSPYVKVGDKVSAGQTIGEVGATGLATGTHLHFILNLNGRDVDPMPYIGASKPSQTTPSTPATGQEEDEEMKLWIAVVGGTWYLVVPTGAGKPNAATLPGDSGMGGGGAAKAGIPVITFANVSALKKVANV